VIDAEIVDLGQYYLLELPAVRTEVAHEHYLVFRRHAWSPIAEPKNWTIDRDCQVRLRLGRLAVKGVHDSNECPYSHFSCLLPLTPEIASVLGSQNDASLFDKQVLLKFDASPTHRVKFGRKRSLLVVEAIAFSPLA